ncbi:GxxExxY protein [Pedobacter terrae]|uniref:GxxExxY protein n=1 Tax=Pedobacter terrae TaxID=405671 RepID=UPI002FFACE14
MNEEQIAKAIVNAAYRVHVELGPGLLESAYETCLIYELKSAGMHVFTTIKTSCNIQGH